MTTQQKEVNQTNTKGIVVGTVIGGVIGAASSLLLAPKGGKELREDISKQSKTVFEKGKDLKDRTREKSQGLLNMCKKGQSGTGEETNEYELSTQVEDPLPAEQDDEEPPAPTSK